MNIGRAMSRHGISRRQTVALRELEKARRRGAPVPPGIRKAWSRFQLTRRVPASLPALTRMPATLRLTDPTAPMGYRTVRPTPGQSAIVPTAAGDIMLTPAAILRSYVDQKKKLPGYNSMLRDNRRRLTKMARRVKRLRRIHSRAAQRRSSTRRGRPASMKKLQRFGGNVVAVDVPMTSVVRDMDRRIDLKLETQAELEQGMQEATAKLDENERRASVEDGLGFLFLGWPLAVIISSLALGGFGITKEVQETRRLEEELAAVEAGTLPRGGLAASAGIGAQIVKAAAPLLLGGAALYLFTRRKRAA